MHMHDLFIMLLLLNGPWEGQFEYELLAFSRWQHNTVLETSVNTVSWWQVISYLAYIAAIMATRKANTHFSPCNTHLHHQAFDEGLSWSIIEVQLPHFHKDTNSTITIILNTHFRSTNVVCNWLFFQSPASFTQHYAWTTASDWANTE